ncbi:Tex family protein [Leeia aquatica]|uniref:RNA-binding transcriptional accessory protein n=1 Tax=Leeia aquatica TaxID=2725557 RepID=A0A847RW29_9NEIS|nr:Tex family protein [Leeia aquatica]NLR74021.1 RNA-binding transcriptional accessory protein [Leeia aquatica]
MLPSLYQRLSQAVGVSAAQIRSAVDLMDEGATVPFIARYRKEVTGGMDDGQLRLLEERLRYLRELDERRDSIMGSIREQGKLSPELEAALLAADTKQTLEDLYLPYKQKRRTKAQIAREAGLGELAQRLLEEADISPEGAATAFINAEAGFADVKAVLDGARHIVIEQMSEQAPLVGRLRQLLWDEGILCSSRVEGSADAASSKFSDYFQYQEALRAIPSHRALALFRGRNESVLQLSLLLPEQLEGDSRASHRGEQYIAQTFGLKDLGRPADKWRIDTVRLAWRAKLALSIELELMQQLREAAETEAIRVFAANLRDLLLAAPAGPRATLGLDPGLRTGVKVAVVDATGQLCATETIYPHAPRNDWQGSLKTLAQLARAHQVELIAIGNGTASRETDKLATELIQHYPELKLQKLVVSEAGASVYSASERAAQEFPQLDVSLRGAVSIARRLQDPLAELVKIEPKAIGVGQYQHDVNQTQLARSLDAVVEDCVNAVGVDVNTASAALLTRVSGLSSTLAQNIVQWRDQHGAFRNRQQLLDVPRLGPKAFEQAAGFLRVNQGDNPLDASAVHPEAYPLVERLLARLAKPIKAVMGDTRLLRELEPASLTDARFGLPTVKDVLQELEKPGRDPRPEFRTASFTEGVETLKDLQPGMTLEGVITNVTNFGAFVDIGVHQDGLVHISALSNKFVKDPREVVKAGQVVKVKVLEVDLPRQRIALTMRLGDEVKPAAAPGNSRSPTPARKPASAAAPANTALADAFARLKR